MSLSSLQRTTQAAWQLMSLLTVAQERSESSHLFEMHTHTHTHTQDILRNTVLDSMSRWCPILALYWLILRERGSKRGTLTCPTYLRIHWLIHVCARTMDWTHSSDLSGQCANHWPTPARAKLASKREQSFTFHTENSPDHTGGYRFGCQPHHTHRAGTHPWQKDLPQLVGRSAPCTAHSSVLRQGEVMRYDF